MQKAVLFDFDGVVVRSEDIHMETFLELLRPYGVSVSRERWYREFSGTGSKHIFEVLVKEFSVPQDVDSLVARRKGMYEKRVRKGELEETPGVRGFLETLRKDGIKTAIVSGSHRTNVKAALDMLDLGGYFDVIVSGDDIRERKPDPGPFLQAAKLLLVRPEDCIAIEDSAPGAEAVRRAGMKLVVVESPALPNIGRYDLLIKDFQDRSIYSLIRS